jgi:hypothetical protein
VCSVCCCFFSATDRGVCHRLASVPQSDDTALASSTMLLLLAQAFCVRHNSCCTTSSYVCAQRAPEGLPAPLHGQGTYFLCTTRSFLVLRSESSPSNCWPTRAGSPTVPEQSRPASTGWGVRFCRCTGRTRRGLGFFTPGTVARAWPLGSDVRAFGHKGLQWYQ